MNNCTLRAGALRYPLGLAVVGMAAFGFLLTGILPYPYGIIRDSQTTMVAVLHEEETGRADSMGGGGSDLVMGGEAWTTVNNWMGWLYPAIWSSTRKLSGADHSIGVLQNLLYWTAMPILFLNLFPRRAEAGVVDSFWFLPWAFFPPALIFMVNITNNAFLLSLILLAGAVYSCGRVFKNTWLGWAGIALLLLAVGVRRDAFLFVLPLSLIAAIPLVSNPARAIGIWLVFLLGWVIVDKIVTIGIDGYHRGINSHQLIWLFDLTGMSKIRGETLIPSGVIKSEMRGNNLGEIQRKIDSVEDIFTDRYFYHGFDVTENPYWFNGLTMGEVLPLYLSNWRTYLRFRGQFAWETLFRHPHSTGSGLATMNHSHIYDGDIENFIPVGSRKDIGKRSIDWQEIRLRWSHEFEKTLPFLFQPWFYLSLALVGISLFKAKEGALQPSGRGRIPFSILLLTVFNFGILCVVGVSIQLRYSFPYFFPVWLISLSLARILWLGRGRWSATLGISLNPKFAQGRIP